MTRLVVPDRLADACRSSAERLAWLERLPGVVCDLERRCRPQPEASRAQLLCGARPHHWMFARVVAEPRDDWQIDELDSPARERMGLMLKLIRGKTY